VSPDVPSESWRWCMRPVVFKWIGNDAHEVSVVDYH
jgi:hypothetical protein